MKSNDNIEIPNRGETSGIPGLPSGARSQGRHVCFFGLKALSQEKSIQAQRAETSVDERSLTR